MNPGELKRRITIKSKQIAANEAGQLIARYVDYKHVWAAILPIQGKEYIEAQGANEKVTHVIMTRYIPQLKWDMQIAYKDKLFDIQSIINIDEDAHTLQIMCIEKKEE